MKPFALLIGLLFTSIVSAVPLMAQHNDEPALLVAKRGDISSTYCDVNPEVFPCSEFCKGNQLADFCRPEYCDHHPEHWTCKPKYIESNDTMVDDVDGGLYATLLVDRTAEQHKDHNFGGGVFSGQDITSVSGTFVAPEVFATPEGVRGEVTGEYVAIAMGIYDGHCDGEGENGGILAAIELFPTGKSEVWLEWLTQQYVPAKDMTISAGDSITMTVELSSRTSGSILIENNSKKTSASHKFAGMGYKSVCNTKAHWAVGQASIKHAQNEVHLAHFTPVVFTNTSVTAGSNVMTGVSNIEEVLLVDHSDNPLADTSIVDNYINVTYVKSRKVQG
ncbi:concanavalin A-like lectin/glucanase, partial [Aureobasidium melanogenum]